MPAEIYQKMAAYIGFGGAKFIPELFEMVANQEEAELCMAMPGTPEDLAERVGESVEDVTRMCRELYHKGLAFKTFKTGTMGYKMCRNFIQFHDGTILWKEAPKEFLDLWQKFMEEEMPRLNRLNAEAMKTRKPANRIIAVEESIESDQQILDADTARQLVMDFKYGVSGAKMCGAWEDCLEANVADATDQIRADFRRLCGFMDDMEKGEKMVFTYIPGEGTESSVKGQRKGTIEGKPFADALYSCWIGPNPPGAAFKKGLLGE